MKYVFYAVIGLMLAGIQLAHGQVKQAGFVLDGVIPLYTTASQGEPLYKAVQALQRDIEKITGKQPVITSMTDMNKPGIIVVNAQQSAAFRKITGWEAHQVYATTLNDKRYVVLEGSDLRGTIYAVYTFCEKVLGVPPLWYYCNWQPEKRTAIQVPAALDIQVASPDVKYRTWFPNDMDLLSPWRKLSPVNNEIWLETALRLKMNTVEWHDEGERSMIKKYAVAPTTLLIHQYGLINTTHHHSPLNASFGGWKQYWEQVRDTIAPELSLANEKKLEEFWRYHIETVKRAGLEMIWVIGFRGAGDHPFWYTFKDAPASMPERGKVISRMLQKQRDLVVEIMGDTAQQFRTIFYDELSDLLADGYIQPPTDSGLIWNFVAARRDHYPNLDLQRMKKGNRNLGYYFNFQFTSTGAHLAAGEGPWKMEQNYRYVAGKSERPLLFSVVNAGNIREFVMELSANAAMMWDMKQYRSTDFVTKYCSTYYGANHAKEVAGLYQRYYQAFWAQKKPDLPGIERQYIFQDLRYKRAISEIVKAIQKGSFGGQPLTDHENEQAPGRTYRIEPADNNAASVLDAVEKGTIASEAAFQQLAEDGGQLANNMAGYRKTFLNDNLVMPAWFMYQLNTALYHVTKAYQQPAAKQEHLSKALLALQEADRKRTTTEYGAFKQWYAKDKIFNLKQLIASLEEVNAFVHQ